MPLPAFLGAVETKRQIILAFIVLNGTALVVSTVVDVFRIDMSKPDPVNTMLYQMLWTALSGVAEEILFRGFARKFLGNGGLVIGTIIWVILHQFYAGSTVRYRLISDSLIGIFYLKLWRGKRWWLALIIHPLWNVAIIGGWQLAKVLLY